ncbi:HipA domain-containing protein [Pseudomonas sp. LS44]|uniref:HipA domain-containing protein n=1 Tax=Pseudomonas sp. LS44 TaxID=1357074 RepID=UPI00215B5CCA|nr:HipA domain-containing protein [Pseudomonas sp. LS44]UVE19532.1 HipA domain-containing protein [Pseudomonas sp. LS44]
MTERQLNVWINFDLIGVLAERNGLWTFTYYPEWLANNQAYPLSPSLPLQEETHVDGATVRLVQWYFDNLLPEEDQRRLIADAAHVGVEDAFGMLQHFGAESAGALSLLPPGEEPERGSVVPLSEEELAARIRNMPQVALAEQAPKRMSLAGAQHKVGVIYDGKELFDPIGTTPSTHILKPEHPSPHYSQSVIIEWFIMTLARRVKLPVPPVYRMYIPVPVFLIERFDRKRTEDGWARMHCIDACQLLDLDRTVKYSQGSVERLQQIADACTIPAVARLALYKWLLFNVLVGNDDAHLKNVSFFITPKGVQLAPFYDLLSTAVWETRTFDKNGWPDQCTTAWPIGTEDKLAQLNRDILLAAGDTLGIKPTTSLKLMSQLAQDVRQEARKLMDEVQHENERIAQERPELQATFAGEMKALRAIVHIVISEMTAKFI